MSEVQWADHPILWVRRDEWDSIQRRQPENPENSVALLVQKGLEVTASGQPDPFSPEGAAARVGRLRYHAARLAAKQFELCAQIERYRKMAQTARTGNTTREGAVRPSFLAESVIRMGVWVSLPAVSPSSPVELDPETLRGALGIGLFVLGEAKLPVGALLSEAASLHHQSYMLATDNRTLGFRLSGWRGEALATN